MLQKEIDLLYKLWYDNYIISDLSLPEPHWECAATAVVTGGANGIGKCIADEYDKADDLPRRKQMEFIRSVNQRKIKNFRRTT